MQRRVDASVQHGLPDIRQRQQAGAEAFISIRMWAGRQLCSCCENKVMPVRHAGRIGMPDMEKPPFGGLESRFFPKLALTRGDRVRIARIDDASRQFEMYLSAALPVLAHHDELFIGGDGRDMHEIRRLNDVVGRNDLALRCLTDIGPELQPAAIKCNGCAAGPPRLRRVNHLFPITLKEFSPRSDESGPREGRNRRTDKIESFPVRGE
jgi:hypothetical protein